MKPGENFNLKEGNVFNIIKEKYIKKMYPRECGRVLEYIICEGENGCSIIPKRRCRKPAAVTKAQPKYFTNYTTQGTIYTMQNGLQ